MVLEWAPPLLPPSPGLEEIHPPSPVLTYIIEYSLVGDKSSFPIQRLDVLGESTAVKVESLSPSTLYSFRVAAVNSAGSGPPAELVVRTLSAPPANAPGNVSDHSVTYVMICSYNSPTRIMLRLKLGFIAAGSCQSSSK